MSVSPPIRRVLATALAAGSLARAGAAQLSARRVPVVGVVYDSLHSRPLKNAFVSILGKSLNTTTDENGRFRFDSLAPGDYVFAAQHESVDSLGFSGFSSKVTVTDGAREVTITVPSFETLWRVACGGSQPSADAGFVYGTVRDAITRQPVPDAFVYLTWSESKVDKAAKDVKQRLWRGDARSDSTGHYSICGVTTDFWLRLSAGLGARASGLIDLPPQNNRLQRRDLFIAASNDSDATRRGTIMGLVSSSDGAPVIDADVRLDDSTAVRSAADGSFTIRGVLPGTRQVEVRAIGMSPVVSVIDVWPRDTARVAVPVRKITTLDIVRVMASEKARMFANELDERRKKGFGYFMDASDITWRHQFSTVFQDLPGTTIDRTGGNFTVTIPDTRGGRCSPDVWIDGSPSSQEGLTLIDPKTTVAVELYSHPAEIPTKFAEGGVRSLCGVILIWTNFAFK